MNTELSQYIEHTLLKPDATKEELEKLFEEAKTYKFKGVCVNGANVSLAKKYLKDTKVKIVTVVGFPLGACKPEIKAQEARLAINDGADEIDMVISVSSIKNKDYDYTLSDIKTVKTACGNIPLKVIIETDLLSEEEIIKACEIIKQSGADFAKTSTGFVKNGIGAKVEDIILMRKTLEGSNVKIKASGGIKTKEKAAELIKAGASRLGTSSGTEIIK